jgi:hypothetical protein
MEAGILGNFIVLAMEAPEVAAHGGNGIGTGPGQEMKERLFLNGIDILGDDPAVYEAVKGAVPVFPYAANPSFARIDFAFMRAQMAMHLLVVQALPKSGFFHRPSQAP